MTVRLRTTWLVGACASPVKPSRIDAAFGIARRVALPFGLAVLSTASLAQMPSNAYDYTRTDQYTYDPVTGFVLTHTVEPNIGALCSVQTFGYDTTGNRTSAKTANCTAPLQIPANAVFATRTSGGSYAAPATQNITVNGSSVSVSYLSGVVPTLAQNAANQSENYQVDPRFGSLLALTGPNALTTRWTLDDFGRVVRQTAADTTSTVSFYCLLAASGVDTSSNTAGCVTPSASEVPVDAVSFSQVEPHNASDVKDGPFIRTYVDRLGRVIRVVTESFDGAGQPAGRSAALVVQDTVYNTFGGVAYTTQPYFLASLSSTTGGSSDVGVAMSTYDVLGRTVQTLVSDPDGNAGSQTFGPFGSRTAAKTGYAYAGYTITTTNDKGQTRVEERNPLGETVRITDANGAQLVHQTDAFGNLVATKDALQNTISIAFDIRGNRSSVNDPDGGITLDCYDALGELVAYQYANMRGANAPGPCPSTPNNGAASANVVSGWVTQAFDVLGRMRQRVEPEFTTTWSYDQYADASACPKGVGKLCQASTTSGFNRKVVYDSLGRPSNVLVTTGTGPSFASAMGFDATTGRVANVTYPTGLQVGYTYTALGYPEKLLLNTAASVTPLAPPPGGVSSGGTVSLPAASVLWQAQSINAWNAIEKQQHGNGVITTSAFEAATGRVTDLKSGAGTATNVLNHHYVWDSLDNLQARNDANGDGSSGAVTETFSYADGLNRLTSYTVAGTSIPGLSRTVALQYNALGMLLFKSDVGNYAYGAQGAGAVRPHALQSVSGPSGTRTNGYDNNGNLTSASAGKYSSLSYTSFNLPDSQSGVSGPGGTPQYTWNYDDTHARIKEVKTVTGANPSTRTTWYMHPDNAGGLGFEAEINSTTNLALNDNRHFLTAAGQVVGVLVSTGAIPAPVGTAPAAAPSPFPLVKVEYWHQDHLGSLAATTDHVGNVTARYAYDPFGKRRFPNGSYDANGQVVVDWNPSTNAGTARGFTGHEGLDDIGLVHMNGRLFDPTLGVFLQPDPLVVHPHNLQSYNRYGYCLNNPLTCTDPSGFADDDEDCTGGGGACDGSGDPDYPHPNEDYKDSNGQWHIVIRGDAPGNDKGGQTSDPNTGAPTPTPTPTPTPDPSNEPGPARPPGGLTPGDLGGLTNQNGPGTGFGGGVGGSGGGGGPGSGGSAGNTGGPHNSPGGPPVRSGPGAGTPMSGGPTGGKYVLPSSGAHQGGSGSSSLMGWVHGGLTAASFAPSIIGSGFSVIDGLVSLAEGDNVGAGISFGAALVGLVSDAGAAKAAAITIREGAAAAREAAAAAKAVDGTKAEVGFLERAAKCFPAGTKVATPNGDVNIEDVRIGDIVRTFDPKTGETAEQKVTGLLHNITYHWVDVHVGADVIRATRSHPFWVESERIWIDAAELKAGMRLRMANGNSARIADVSFVDLQQPESTYNLEVEVNHDYFVGALHVLVHNGDGSYTITFASGKQYVGKGDISRMNDSAERIFKQTGDRIVSRDWTPANGTADSFVQEEMRMREAGGPKGNTYNIINSPGDKIATAHGCG